MGSFQGLRPWSLLVRCNFSPHHLQLSWSCTSWSILQPAPGHLDLDTYERALLFSSPLRAGLAPIYPAWAPALIRPCPSGHLYLRPLTLAWPSQLP